MGHGRGAAVGDIMASILSFAGWDVEREYYINDAGLQIELLGKSAQARYFEALGAWMRFLCLKMAIRVSIWRISLICLSKNTERPLPKSRYLETLEFFSAKTSQIVVGMIKKDLEEFGVRFDVWFSEKSLYDDGLIEPAKKALKERDYAYEEDGALWFRSTLFNDDKDRVLVRANGMPTYFMSDAAYLKNKYDRNFEKLIYVWGADHHGYVPRIKSMNKAFGYNEDALGCPFNSDGKSAS